MVTAAAVVVAQLVRPLSRRRSFSPSPSRLCTGAKDQVLSPRSSVGGYIEVESEHGKGATFKLHFPVVSPGRPSETATVGEYSLANHGRVALLVEDDTPVRTMATRGLIEAGYAVLEAAHGRAALKWWGATKGAGMS